MNPAWMRPYEIFIFSRRSIHRSYMQHTSCLACLIEGKKMQTRSRLAAAQAPRADLIIFGVILAAIIAGFGMRLLGWTGP